MSVMRRRRNRAAFKAAQASFAELKITRQEIDDLETELNFLGSLYSFVQLANLRRRTNAKVFEVKAIKTIKANIDAELERISAGRSVKKRAP